MVKEVIWINRAKKNLKNIIYYLKNEWTENVAEDFYSRTIELVDLIKEFPDIGRKMNKRSMLRQILISKHNYMVYKIIIEKLLIVNIFDTRQSLRK